MRDQVSRTSPRSVDANEQARHSPKRATILKTKKDRTGATHAAAARSAPVFEHIPNSKNSGFLPVLGRPLLAGRITGD
jgi:hypothetical protein